MYFQSIWIRSRKDIEVWVWAVKFFFAFPIEKIIKFFDKQKINIVAKYFAKYSILEYVSSFFW
jgi:hypothetical protein